MTKGPNVHVVYDSGDEQWKVKQAGNIRASSVHNTKAEAVEAAKPIAQKNQSEVIKHYKDNGRFQDSDSHGNDPHPPKG